MEYLVKSSETVHVGRFDVVCEKIIKDDCEYPFSYVKIKNCAAAICFIGEDVILLKEYRHTFDTWEWEIPAGSIEEGDDPQDTIVREIKEETGCVVEKIRYLGWYHLSVGSTTEKVFIFFANCSEPENQDLEALERIEVYRVKKEDFEKMINDNEIHQCMGVVAWHMYKIECLKP